MGKNQHSKDKLHITATEWSELYGGKRTAGESTEFKRLPFDCCSISFTPFESPVCTPAGTIYDTVNILKYLKKFGTDPATGEKLEVKSLIRLNFHKNSDGKYHCPVTFKVFNENTNIVAIKPTGNVYSKEAVDTLNIKAKNLKDLLDDTPFVRADIITIQDPADLSKFNLQTFFHMRNGLKLDTSKERLQDDYRIRTTNSEAAATMTELKATEAKWKKTDLTLDSAVSAKAAAAPKDGDHKAHYSTGEASRSFTSTHMSIHTTNTAASVDDDVVRNRRIKEKGYVQLRTSLGDLNLELHCDYAPKACENFLLHCKSGYYAGTKFHRLIPGFMVQGGDPTGSGAGGKSAFKDGAPFATEPTVGGRGHIDRGVLAMANAGPDTNKSQFYLTFKPAPHLDGKHTVFGRIVGGLDTLDRMEATPVDTGNRPISGITLFEANVYVDPFENLRVADEAAARKKAAPAAADAVAKPTVYREGVGKYLSVPLAAGAGAGAVQPRESAGAAPAAAAASEQPSGVGAEPPKKKLKSGKGGFSDFGAW